jgi:hypothetical protein
VQAQDHFFDLSGVLYVNYLATQALDIRGGYGASLDALVDTKVLRISYASPLEVTLAVSSLAGSAVLVAGSCVGLFNAVQHARVSKADADLKVEVRRQILTQVQTKTGPAKRGFPTVDVDELIEGATRAAINVAAVDVYED